MIVPADEAPMTNGSPYVVRQPPARGAAIVAKMSLLRNRAMHVGPHDATTAFEPPALCPPPPGDAPREWRYLGPSSLRRQGARPGVRAHTGNYYSSFPVDVRMVSTTVASARVVVSPRGWPLAMSRRSRRMILPERVLGSSGANMIV